MNKITLLVLFLSIGLISCETSNKEIDTLELANKYYEILNNSDDSVIVSLLTDSIVISEKEFDYAEGFSKKGYMTWLKWDAVFDPTYEILHIEKEDEIVKAKISKMDKRIDFLHKEPIVWNEIIRFENDKIIQVERIKYLTFKDSIFVKNRDELSSWIDKSHPELNGFLNDQTETGGMNYLKAIALFKNRK